MMQITVMMVMLDEEMTSMGSTDVPAQGLYERHAGLDDGHPDAARDLIRDRHHRIAGQARGARHDRPGPDRRLIRAAEASARQAGLRASAPDPAAAGNPGYAADLARRGSGRGIGPGGRQAPDGPGAGA
jgi:hypothetical protein